MIDEALHSPAFLDNMSVVGVVESSQGHARDLVLIRQFHGGKECVPKLLLQPDFATQYIEHHNQIRAACVPLFEGANNHLIVEGYGIEEHCVFSRDHASNIFNFEQQHLSNSVGVNAHQYALHTQIENLLTETERMYCLKPVDEYDWDNDEEMDALFKATSGHFLNEYCEGFIGSFRMAAHMIMSGKARQVHGMELGSKQYMGLPDSSQDFTLADKIEHDRRRVSNAVSQFQQQVLDGCAGVLVIGASHTQIGTKAPLLPAVRLFEEIVREDLPDTRLIVVEPKVKVWDTVEWAA